MILSEARFIQVIVMELKLRTSRHIWLIVLIKLLFIVGTTLKIM